VFAVFLALAFGWSWAFWGPAALVELDYLASSPAVPAFGAFGPSVAGVSVVAWRRGPGGVVALGRRAIDWRFPGRFWAAIFLLFPAVATVAAVVSAAVGVELPTPPWAGQPLAIPIAFGYILLLGGPLQEEFGWRGYALDPLAFVIGLVGVASLLVVLWRPVAPTNWPTAFQR